MRFNELCKTQVWNKTIITIFLIITCGILIPSYTATLPDDSKAKTKQREVDKRLDQSVANDTANVSSGKSSGLNTPNNLTSVNNGSSFDPFAGSSDLNGGLLTDPSHPTFGTGHVGAPIAQPSDLFSSPLLTAAPSLSTGSYNSSFDSNRSKNKLNQGYNNTLGQHPILSGSMAIALPTPSTTSMSAQATQPASAANGAVSYSSLSSNTVLAIITAEEATPTPTTSTAYVFATNSPISSGTNNPLISSGSASSTANSSAHNLLPSPIYPLVGLGLAVLLVVQLNSS